MTARSLALLLLISLTLGTAASARANPCGVVPDTLLLLDRSGSMKDPAGSQTKWSIAVSAVNNVTATFSGQLHFGLMLFSRWPHVSNCSSGQVNVPVGPATSGPIAAMLGSAYPSGDTPIALSLDAARTYLKGIKSSKPQYAILVTDGMETCQPASVNTPQGAAARLLSDGVKTYVVGFGSGVDPASLTATAQAGGTGSYYQADNLSTLSAALKKIAAAISCCGDAKVDPGETCDTAIPLGQPGACPQSCNDGNPCTIDQLTGSACSTGCSYTAVSSFSSGDGCCPPGASSATDSDCPASCGNGVVDSGEKCDTGIPSGQWGGCPLSCDDGNACTADTVTGTGCNAACAHTNICTANACGDGKVDPGEWCDTAIPAGQPGACPQSCHDGSPCTSDLLMGSGCLARCAYLPITMPVNGDGCCPPGASSSNDSDCSGTCGDGVLDAGETCDPGIIWGAGACKTAQDCADTDPCTIDFVSGSACAVICATAPVLPSAAVKDGCCPQGLSQAQDADCPPPCDPDRPGSVCFNPCQGVICKDGEYCQSGKCVPWPDDSDNENPGGGTGSGYGTGGCDCRVSGGGEAALGLLLGLLAVVGLRRRRR